MQQLKLTMFCILGCFICCSLHAQPNIAKIEYYVDTDPGYGKAKPVSFTTGMDIADQTIALKTNTLPAGIHNFGIRARDANGVWSYDYKWLFLKPEITDTSTPNIGRIEYYIDTDPGYGNAINIPVTNGKEIGDAVVSIDPATLKPGLHFVGMRSRDANGVWSYDYKWLFLKAETTINSTPDILQIECYIDKDPGYGKAIPIAIAPGKEFPDFNLPVNVSTLDTGKHIFYIRGKDRNGSWSYDYKYEFRIQPATPAASIIVNSISKKLICAGNTVDISFDARGTFDTANVFTVQLSNINGSFASPKNIGSVTGKKSSIVTCSIPANTGLGFGYRVRVVSTNQPVTGATGLDTLTVASPPAVPTITANGPTTFCQGGNVKLTSSVATSYLWTNGDTTRTTTINKSGNYRVTVTNSSGCTATSLPITVTVNPLPVATITANGNTTDVCPGQAVMLTASPGASYSWSTNAITQSITVGGTGNYFVTITNANGCSKTSDTTIVTYQGCSQPSSLATSNISATGARLSWSAVNCAVGYQYQWKIKGTSAWTSATTTGTNKPVNGLTASTTYQWRVITGCQTTPDTISSGYISGPEFKTLPAAATYTSSKVLMPENEATVFGAVVIPNPVKANAVVELEGNFSEARITLSDLTGKILWKSPVVKEKQIKLPLSNLAPGIYMVNVYSGKETRIIKIVKD